MITRDHQGPKQYQSQIHQVTKSQHLPQTIQLPRTSAGTPLSESPLRGRLELCMTLHRLGTDQKSVDSQKEIKDNHIQH